MRRLFRHDGRTAIRQRRRRRQLVPHRGTPSGCAFCRGSNAAMIRVVLPGHLQSLADNGLRATCSGALGCEVFDRRRQFRIKNLFEAARVEEVKERMAQLRPNSERLWGKMNAAQAVAHCSAGLEWALEDRIPPWMFLGRIIGDRKSTRLNSSHDQISYAVFCLKKKKNVNIPIVVSSTDD